MPGSAVRRCVLPVLLALAALRPAAAQCPDGTPPPCRPSGIARRPANPPLDARTWIVLPFENIARAPDIEWLREASVNLLYLDLSRWRDIRVIDDERVADLMRAAAPAGREAQLSLETGLAVARRAGAGRLVMGDLLKVGNRTAVIAKVFNVQTGRRERTVRQETAHADSLMHVFSRLAQAILAVEGARSEPGITGTTSLEAYREYLTGLRHLNAWELDSAASRFRAALRADTGFALARYKLSVVLGWQSPGSPERRVHAEAANRMSAALPPRERALIRGQHSQVNDRWGEACETYAELVRSDSSDVEAWYNLGECNFHDPMVEATPDDSTRFRFRSSWELSLRSFRRALELDPSYHLAFAHIHDILSNEFRAGCQADTMARCASAYLALPLLVADTIATEPLPLAQSQRIGTVAQSRERSDARRRFNELALDIAQQWVYAGPNEGRARLALGRALLRLGRLERARLEMAQASPSRLSVPDLARWVTDRLEIDLRIDSFAPARRMLDTLAQLLLPQVPQGSERTQATQVLAAISGIFGQHRRAASLLGDSLDGRYRLAVIRLANGLVPDSLGEIETAYRDWYVARQPPAQRAQAQWLALRSSLFASVGTTRRLPAGPRPADPGMRLVASLLSGDTAAARPILTELDSAAMATPVERGDALAALFAAVAWLQLGDTSTVMARLGQFIQRLRYTQLLAPVGTDGALVAGGLLPRGWLLVGDLAAATANADLARSAYRRVLSLWAESDPELQPVLNRVRAALARLGS